ncbi:MAG: 3-phosphoshikimate 1-carboxyvinyltransferase [Flavobacteriales bacterium]|nr:MAG: 3-phosphoshikimate 1-carboxyvinyltransferase [Flavobacteriales bacterium]
MSITLSHPKQIVKGEIQLTSSKSESNRALIIQALCDDTFEIENLSISNDTVVLQKLLSSRESELSVNLAGTAMRFLTAYLAIQDKEVVLTGAQRMKERPIKVLVDVLKQIGANIFYEENEGYPPLKIKGTKLQGQKVIIDGGISSQYISALLMIAPKLDGGLTLEFEGEIISRPYINMTIEMMRYFGAEVNWKENSIVVGSGNYKAKDFKVEADWSAASYWYSMVALAKEADITLYGLKKDSLQGDSVVQEIYKSFGVETEFVEGGIRLTKKSEFTIQDSPLNIDFVSCPDIAQTVAVTCAALNVEAKLTGLKTLRIKETDRISALQTELTKLGFSVDVEGDDFLILPSLRTESNGVKQSHINNDKIASFPFGSAQGILAMTNIKTYDDHRMAMAFAPLALQNSIIIEDEDVVGKSYPDFWKDLVNVEIQVD